jgi:hypothetical protein
MQESKGGRAKWRSEPSRECRLQEGYLRVHTLLPFLPSCQIQGPEKINARYKHPSMRLFILGLRNVRLQYLF